MEHYFEIVTNKSLSKLTVKLMIDRLGPDLWLDTLIPKLDSILWLPGWANLSHFVND